MRRVIRLSASLLCCVLFYIAIWIKIHETSTGPQNVFYAVFWTDDHVTTEDVTAETEMTSLNLSSRTIMKILFKKDYKQLPEWNFEDVYMRNTEDRHSVCPKSLQNSKDEKFQSAFVPDVQLWLHEGHLNITEWNRLAHFNNPFGFMEYTYSDIKPSVDLIPKPKSPQLLAVADGADDVCIRCAVMGTGGILNNSGMGKEIDSHHYVFRVNGAVIKGFEEDVGSRTSVYVHTSYALWQSSIHLRQYGFNSTPADEGVKYVLIPEGLRDFQWIQTLLQKKNVTTVAYKGVKPLQLYSGNFDQDRFYVLHPDFLRYVRNRFLRSNTLSKEYWDLYRPTNGAFTLFLALHTCDIVNVYGFITADYDKYSNYYFEKDKKTRLVFYLNHDYGLEMQMWKNLHDSGIINLYQRKENQTMT